MGRRGINYLDHSVSVICTGVDIDFPARPLESIVSRSPKLIDATTHTSLRHSPSMVATSNELGRDQPQITGVAQFVVLTEKGN